MDQASGYVTDLGYVKAYAPEFAASRWRWAQVSAGRPPLDIRQNFTKADLGCGYGLALLMDAAIYPQAEFIGVDINPTHTRWATDIAAEAGLTNIRFLQRPFAVELAQELPATDFICMHGVWSWVSGDNRKILCQLIQQTLTPHGEVALSYNVLPGWSVKRALRELLMRKFLSTPGSTPERIAVAIEYAKQCREASAPLFTFYPELSSELDSIAAQPRNYVAHEYFNVDWTNFYQYEVATSFNEMGLRFAGSAQVLDNLEKLSFGHASIKILNQVAPDQRETLKDVLLNRSFRYDIYTAQTESFSWDQVKIALCNSQFLSLGPSNTLPKYLTPDAQAWTLSSTEVEALAASLQLQPHSGRQLAKDFNAEGERLDRLCHSLLLLLGAGAISAVVESPDQTERVTRARRLNAAILNRSIRGDQVHVLLSPVDGLGHEASLIDQFFIAALMMGKDPVSYALRGLRAAGLGLSNQGKLVSDADAMVREVEKRLTAFQSQKQPMLKQLAII